MIHKDYLLRILQQFFEEIAKYLRNKKEYEIENPQLQTQLTGLYTTFFNQTADFYISKSADEIITSFDEQERLIKIEMLSELIYQDALLKPQGETRQQLLQKSLDLFEYLNAHSATYSIPREQEMEQIKHLIRSEEEKAIEKK